VYEFDHTVEFTTDSYLALQETFWSDKQDSDGWGEFRTAIRDYIDSIGGCVKLTYTTLLFILIKQYE